MVSIKIDLKKRDFFWIVPLIMFIGIGVTYAYGGNNPLMMGHNAGELEISWSDVSNKPNYDCGTEFITSINLESGQVVCGDIPSVFDLVFGQHSSEQCTGLGGSVEDDGDKFCKFTGSCPSGWVQYKSWSTTSSVTCRDSPSNDGSEACGEGGVCTTGSHAFSNRIPETCSYTDGYQRLRSCYSQTLICSATRTQIGCY